MSRREPRNGYVTVSVELPRDVADLLADRHGDLVKIIEALGHECRYSLPNAEARAKTERLREQKRLQRQAEYAALGRRGYRLFRLRGGGKSILKRRDLIDQLALELGVNAQLLEHLVLRFKRAIEAKVRKRRGREITRLYWAGKSNGEIASQLNVHASAVSKYISEVVKPTGRPS